MHREGRPLWKKIFGNPGGQEREEKVLAYIANRLQNGASLREALGEDYVRRNLSRAEVDEVIKDPELLRAVRGHMESTFGSGGVDLDAPSGHGREATSG